MQTNEADIVHLSYTNLQFALDERMDVLFSTQPALELTYFYPGLFREDTPLFQPDNPFEDIRVREAFARSIDREAIDEFAFAGMGSPAHVLGCHLNDFCFDSQWGDDFFDVYGFDPERSRELLAEAGYPDGFVFEMVSASPNNFPSLVLATEIVADMAFQVGFEPILQETDYRSFQAAMTEGPINQMFGLALPNQQITESVRSANYSGFGGSISGPQRLFLDEAYEAAIQPSTPEDQFFAETDIGFFKFYEYIELPLLWLPGLVVVNPETVFDYVFPGTVPGIISHLEYVEPLR